MIIQLESATAEDVAAARRSLDALAASWGVEAAVAPRSTAADDLPHKGIDPVALISLVVSIPSAVLAVADIADRIMKRRRAKELIEQARQLSAEQQVSVLLVERTRTFELRSLEPDQLLELLAAEEKAGD
jgi:hypothetical protein